MSNFNLNFLKKNHSNFNNYYDLKKKQHSFGNENTLKYKRNKEINNFSINKIQSSFNKNNRCEYNNYDYENDLNIINNSFIPKINKNKSNEGKKVLRNKINKYKKENLTLLTTNFDNNNNKYILHNNSNLFLKSNNSNNIKLKKIKDIQNFKNLQNNNKSYINKNNHNKIKLNSVLDFSKITNQKINENNKNLILLKKEPNLSDYKNEKLIYNFRRINNSIKPKNSYNLRVNISNRENNKSNNKIKDKIIKMEKEFTVNDVKKILINRPIRTLNSKIFQFDFKELENISPTLKSLNNSREKLLKTKVKRQIFEFSQRYTNHIKNNFDKNYSFIKMNEKINRTKINNLFNLSDEINKSSDKKSIFNSKIGLINNKGRYNDIKVIKKYSDNPSIKREYQKSSEYIRRSNKPKFLKNFLLTTSLSNNFDNRSNYYQFSF